MGESEIPPELYREYQRIRERLSEYSSPVPQFFREIMMLYGVDLPLYLVPYWLVSFFADEEAYGNYWIDKIHDRPLGILIACDRWKEEFGGRNMAMLKTLLHEMGHHLFRKEQNEFRFRILEKWDMEELRKEIKDEKEIQTIYYLLLVEAVENRINRWVEEQWRRLRKYVNDEVDGWREGVTFEQVRRRFRYNHRRYRNLFKI